MNKPTAEEVLADPAASYWLKSAICEALRRDPVDALNDAEVLCAILAKRLERLHQGEAS